MNKALKKLKALVRKLKAMLSLLAAKEWGVYVYDGKSYATFNGEITNFNAGLLADSLKMIDLNHDFGNDIMVITEQSKNYNYWGQSIRSKDNA